MGGGSTVNLFLEGGEMFNGAIPSFLGFLHTLYTLTLRLHQGFYGFSTQKLSGYYDYLYIYRPTFKTNLSLYLGAT